MVHKSLLFEYLHEALDNFDNFWHATSGKKSTQKTLVFCHLTLILSLQYLVKCRLLNLLLASGDNACSLHSCWRRTFWARVVI